jgi:hypothetical protein
VLEECSIAEALKQAPEDIDISETSKPVPE